MTVLIFSVLFIAVLIGVFNLGYYFQEWCDRTELFNDEDFDFRNRFID